jgi:hypothetical protein
MNITRRQFIEGIGAAVASFALPEELMALVKLPETPLATLAKAFLQALDPEQRRQAVFPFENRERLNWHYIPRRRRGIPLKQMDAKQRAAADALLRVALSEVGYRKAMGIMQLEEVLRQLEFFSFLRDQENYAFTFFGDPAATPWGWRVEGHHLSLNFTAISSEFVAVTPAFMGANPAKVPEGPHQGLQVLKQEQALARELVQSLEPAQLDRALIAARSLGDIVTGPGRADNLKAPVGLPLREMSEGRRDLAVRLIEEYIRNMQEGFASVQRRLIQEAGIEGIHFAWAGGLKPGQAHYYRLHGPRLLIEYDNTQNNANHIHSVWRDPVNDFGADLLQQHYTSAVHHPTD